MAWNRPSNDGRANTPGSPRRGGTPRPAVRWTVAGAIIVLCAVGAWWFLVGSGGRGATHPAAKENPTHIRDVKPNQPARGADADATNVVAKAESEEKWEDGFEKIPEKRYKFSKLVSATTAECGVVTERWRMPNGKYWRHQVDPPPIFDNPSDNAIARVLGDRSGAPMPPCPELDAGNLNDAFMKSLLSPIEIKEDDKPWVVALKLSVKEARSEIARLIKEGDTRSVGEILRDHLDENNRQAELRGDALKGYYKTLGESGEEAAAEYLNKVNKALEKFGVSPIKTNPQTERRSSRK